MSKPRFLDFFAGSGLVTEALKPYFQAVWANDNSCKKADVYRVNHVQVRFDPRSIEAVEGNELPSAELGWASFPCQDLSLAGPRSGIHGQRSGMVWQWLRVIQEMGDRRPPVVAVENVGGLVSAADGRHYRMLHDALRKLGYKAGAVLLDAAHWVPQSRPRIFVVAVEKTVPLGVLQGDGPTWLHNNAIIRAIEGLDGWVWWNLPQPTERRKNVADIVEWEAAHDDEAMTKRNLSLVPERHQKRLLCELANGFRVAPGYKRTRGKQVLELRFDGMAGCLRTPEGGSSRQFLVLKKPDGRLVTRLITIPEAGRLMGVPPNYKLPGGYNDAYAALGDAVAVPAVRFLGKHLLLPLVERTAA